MSFTDFFGPEMHSGLNIFLGSAIVWVPIILIGILWDMWLTTKREQFIDTMEWTSLEVRIPKEVFKSPLAMELVLIKAIHQTGGIDTWLKRYIQGSVLSWFSLEIVSIEGKIFFIIRTQKKFRNLIESQIYAQYPQAEINELSEDYAEQVPRFTKNGDWLLWGAEFKLSKPDPYPIKTYVDYGLDKASTTLEAEQQIDPITLTLEYMGSLKAGEQMWFQILVRAHHAKQFHKPGTWFEKRELKDLADEEIKKIFEKSKFKPKDKDYPEGSHMSKGQQDVVSAIERKMEKLQFDCGIRALYIAKKDKFDPSNITGMNAILKQYNTANLNGFGLTNNTSFDYPWQDYSGNRAIKLKREIFDAYRARAFFYPPHKSIKVAGKKVYRKPMVLSSEELATIYHFPGRVSETPSFKRIESKKAEPPVDLPI